MFKKFRLFRKFRFKKWQTYSPQKRLEFAQNFENYFAKKQGRKKHSIIWSDKMGENSLGVCNYGQCQIQINANLIIDGSKMFLLMSTILHEGRHAFQYAYVNKEYQKKSRISKLSKAYKWKNAIGGYLSEREGNGDYADYANQSIELDANMYAYKQLKKMKRKYSNIEEYTTEISRLENWFEYAEDLGKEKYGMFYKFKIGRKNKKQFKKNLK